MTVLSFPQNHIATNKRLVVVVPAARFFTVSEAKLGNDYRLVVLLVPKGSEYSVDDEDMGQLHLVRQLALVGPDVSADK